MTNFEKITVSPDEMAEKIVDRFGLWVCDNCFSGVESVECVSCQKVRKAEIVEWLKEETE